PCRVCSSTFQDESKRKRHRLQKHSAHLNSTGICCLCGNPASNLFEFADHFNERHSDHLSRLLSHASTRMGTTPEMLENQLFLLS
ncbi:hypothetical protein PENTCL1PPCAC_9240, partial [Pristionchus entomophagus]